jgi:small-conductance mechanosensitive channel
MVVPDAQTFEIYKTIQVILAPVFLLTAVSGIINVLISRLARAVDRRRILEESLPEYIDARRDDALRELRLLNKRIVLVLWSVALAVLAGLLVCLLIGTAFAGAYVALDLSRPVAILFIGAVVALTGCLLLFLREISIAAFSARQTVAPQTPRLDRRKATAEAK